MKRIIAFLLVLTMALALVACGNSGKAFTVVVADQDGSETTFNYTSKAATVGEALLAEGLIAGEDSDWGLMVNTVNGITADWATENAYWAFFIDGEYAQTGVSETELTDGATYRFEKTVSYTDLGQGATTFYVTVQDMDQTVTKFRVSTDETNLGAALLGVGLVEGEQSEFGLYVTTVNGITADWDNEGTYWAFLIEGEYAQTGVDGVEITANANYSLVKTGAEG